MPSLYLLFASVVASVGIVQADNVDASLKDTIASALGGSVALQDGACGNWDGNQNSNIQPVPPFFPETDQARVLKTVQIDQDANLAWPNNPVQCGQDYELCQKEIRKPFSRIVGTYEVKPAQGLSQEKCPVVPNFDPNTGLPFPPALIEKCTCQKALSQPSASFLKVCREGKRCCPACSCWGDPHCKSFQGWPKKSWLFCHHPTRTQCLAAKDDRGLSCTWKLNRCFPQEPFPSMVMYEKDGFKIVLTVGSLAAIAKIDITDGQNFYSFGFDDAYRCTVLAGNVPLVPVTRIINGVSTTFRIATLDNLQSRVSLDIRCFQQVRFPRLIVYSLRDKLYGDFNNPLVPNPGGFCHTNQIVDNDGNVHNDPSSFLLAEQRLCQRLQLATGPAGHNTDRCKQEFIAQFNHAADNLPTFMNKNLNGPSNLIVAACAILYMQFRDMDRCLTDDKCQICVDDIMDFAPFDGSVFNTYFHRSNNPTAQCDDILQNGFAQPLSLPPVESGLTIEKQSGANWIPVFKILDSALESCTTQCVSLNFTNTPVMDVGTYRIVQQIGYDPTNPPDDCRALPGYGVELSNTAGVADAVSTPLNQLVSSGKLVCHGPSFPGCPNNYKCCQWRRSTAPSVWESCMIQFHGPNVLTTFPNCCATPSDFC